jgi:hypothetical protein
MMADFVNLHSIGMLQLGRGLCFGPEWSPRYRRWRVDWNGLSWEVRTA